MNKTPEQLTLADLVDFLVDQQPRWGYDADNLKLDDKQCATVTRAFPDVIDPTGEAITADSVAAAFNLGIEAREWTWIAGAMLVRVQAIVRKECHEYLLPLLIAESERREACDDKPGLEDLRLETT